MAGGLTPLRLDAAVVPELGPSLARLCVPADAVGGRAGRIPLDDLRLGLVTRIFEAGGAARRAFAAGDAAAGTRALGRDVWLAAWDAAVAEASVRLGSSFDAEIRAAAVESRLPAKRLERVTVTDDERRLIAAHLGAPGMDFLLSLDALTAAADPVVRGGETTAWREALLAAARRLETAWLDVEEAAAAEEHRWRAEAAVVRAWRRPRWPLWIATVALVALAVYAGLALGGYAPVPSFLRGAAEWWWNRP